MTGTTVPALDELFGYIKRLEDLDELEPLDRAKAARKLYDSLHAAVAAVRDEAVCQALLETVDTPEGPRRRTYRMVADELDLTVNTVNSIVTRYRTWLRNVAKV